MSLQAMDWALRIVRGLSPTQKLILICLGNHAGPDGKCWPSQGVISEYTELSRETIYRNLCELEKKGLIRSVKRRDAAGRDLSKTYLLNLAMTGETQSLTGVANRQGGETQSLTQENHGVYQPTPLIGAKSLGETQNLTGETESLRGGDDGSHPGETQSLTSKENQSRKEPVNRSKRLNTLARNDFSEVEKSASEPDPSPSPPKSDPGIPENENLSKAESGSSPVADSVSPRPENPATLPPHRRIRLDPGTFRFQGILPDDLRRFKDTFPAVDVEQELREMELWAAANPARRKSNWFRFIGNWLSKEQERGGALRTRPPGVGRRSTNIDELIARARAEEEERASNGQQIRNSG